MNLRVVRSLRMCGNVCVRLPTYVHIYVSSTHTFTHTHTHKYVPRRSKRAFNFGHSDALHTQVGLFRCILMGLNWIAHKTG